MQRAIAEARIARNPCRGLGDSALPVDAPREMRFLDVDELLAVADAVRPLHYRPLILTAGLVGLRWGELAGLRIDRLNLLGVKMRTAGGREERVPVITVDQQLVEVGGAVSFGPPKTGAGKRTVTIPRTLVDVLEEHIGSTPVVSSGLVFPTPSGAPMRARTFAASSGRHARTRSFATRASSSTSSATPRPLSRSQRVRIRSPSRSALDTPRSR